jgi:hypothetical protein
VRTAALLRADYRDGRFAARCRARGDYVVPAAPARLAPRSRKLGEKASGEYRTVRVSGVEIVGSVPMSAATVWYPALAAERT